MTDTRPPSDASDPNLRAIVERYFERMRAGDPEIASLLADDIRWIAPRSSPVGQQHEGKPAVLELMSTGVGPLRHDAAHGDGFHRHHRGR